ncbi:hypothetical protein PNOK_0977500 [Pyrrhoderma noxium]|uniref:Uncharacterized protein n=1 Tax=Pyrrhoderma noxium TaxID=2282107 RepID=A0A286U543_9AGAM|nr:hypothetical protein PNOK_0977500 [Pyrrhoderma noxium]
MPRYLNSIKNAHWPTAVVNMLQQFFEAIQRHYEAHAKPIGRFFTISQAVYELRNKFHAHLKHNKEALILSLDSSDLEHIREELQAQRDDSQLFIDSYRSLQREAAHKQDLIATQYTAPPAYLALKRNIGADIKNYPT